ncbi:MAG: NAD-dependent epimerase/dehydratase family protein [Spirochaetes bacterium]|nr:NAD-dependent epimerase/dehydratase family protein [Spirochaetota bacterium]
MKVLVTGATGFIGSVLVKKLLARRDRVRALAFPGEDTGALEKAGVEVRRGDLTDPASLRGLCEDIDTIYHLAGRVTDWGTKKQFYDAIYTATENLLKEASGKSRRFVYTSSIAAMGFGRHLRGVRETDPPRKSGVPYNDAKADAEALVRQYHDDGAVRCTIVRPANVVGPGSAWVRDIVAQMRGSVVPLVDGGRYSTSFVEVENLADGMILAGTKEVAVGKAYHFRDDWDISWKRYVEDLGRMIGKRPHGNLPFRVAWIMGTVLEFILNPLHVRSPLTRLAVSVIGRDNDVDTNLARGELGWKTVVTYEKAMEKIGAWLARGN